MSAKRNPRYPPLVCQRLTVSRKANGQNTNRRNNFRYAHITPIRVEVPFTRLRKSYQKKMRPSTPPPRPRRETGGSQAGTRQMVLPVCRPAGHSKCRARALQIFQAPPALRPLRPLRLKTALPLSVRSACSVRPLATGAAKWYNRAILSDGGHPLQRTEDPAQRNKRKAGAMDNYAAPAEMNGRAAGGTIRRSDGMTSREAPAGRIDHVDEGKSLEGKLFCTGGRSEGLRSPSGGACVPPQGNAGRRTHKNAALAPSKRLRGGASLRRSQAEVRGRSPRPFAPSLARKPPCMRRDCAERAVRGK